MRSPRQSAVGQRERAQTSTIGLVLVLAMVLGGTITVVAFGGIAITDTQHALSIERAEKSMTQLDSKAALVALGGSEVQQVSLPGSDSGQYTMQEDTGWMNISIDSSSGGDKTIFNHTLGALVYQNGRTKIAYQGGGVWRTSSQGNSLMISPPEFHYRGRTLTVPGIQLSGTEAVDGTVSMSDSGTTEHFPDSSEPGFTNPVEGEAINVTIKSEYYRAWGAYFEQRTNGNVTYDDANQTARIVLVPIFDETFNNAVGTTAANGITVNGPDPPPTPNEQGINYPVVDQRIESQIDECQNVPGACDSIPGTITSPGTYFKDGDYSGDLDVSSPGGNVTVVINGNFSPADTEYLGISDPHLVTVYVKGDFSNNADYNVADGDPAESAVLLHSTGDFTMNGNSQYVGLVYAPQSSCTQNGGGSVTNIEGGIICNTLTMNGEPNDVQYNSDIRNIGLGLNSDNVTQLQYLHVTTNEITISN
jgi:hypothetical protein